MNFLNERQHNNELALICRAQKCNSTNCWIKSSANMKGEYQEGHLMSEENQMQYIRCFSSDRNVLGQTTPSASKWRGQEEGAEFQP